ncbi:UTP--glucose-1-phosphate uridylyltransferase GalU [Natranaerobius thermophilus]|uniref:UTP--glucose-1-phosphate uridylyltransferase n=1 Tax=Natranaerobius thermophilus (strain ATCC BAA-1301 / DSM 18059 / JW/NM-WN-LF) TaxID=457570 RepID=B2A4I1_NATTJ|nr:UTP--glucose-1-phosphate uridylyltransferase GalU [Natranaerobius thermophilus]ACB85158.1 UDP-glucose pyrophosphorylase [Natranaerobius thermophilus JW/NM-WN-LF]
MNIKKAIIPVAGFGTRLLPITKAIPKTMLPIVDKPVIHYLVEEAVASGIEEIIIITGQKRKNIEDYFNRSQELEEHLIKTGKEDLLEQIKNISNQANINYVAQDSALGLGHAIYCGRKFIDKDESFAVLLGDDIVRAKKPCIAQLIDVYRKYRSNIIGVQSVPDEEVSKYGIVNGKRINNKLVKVSDLVEKPDKENTPSNLAILGRYIIHSDIFDVLEVIGPGAGGEIQLTDALKALNYNQNIYSYSFEGTRYDTGDKLGYLIANIEFALQNNELKNNLKNKVKPLFF